MILSFTNKSGSDNYATATIYVMLVKLLLKSFFFLEEKLTNKVSIYLSVTPQTSLQMPYQSPQRPHLSRQKAQLRLSRPNLSLPRPHQSIPRLQKSLPRPHKNLSSRVYLNELGR